jgi:membrane protein
MEPDRRQTDLVDRWKRMAGRLLQFVLALWDQVQHDKVVIRASGLAYSSLLAIVPLITVLFALFTAFGAFDDLKSKVQELLFSQFLPSHQDEIVNYMDQFVANSRSLGFAGFVALIVTAILLLDNIESNFNDVWHVTTRRKLISKITAYTTVLVFGTILIGVGVTVSASLEATLLTQTGIELSALTRIGGWFFPLVTSFVAFLLMFLIIPSTRVRFRSAAIGALGTSIAWELGKGLFAHTVGQSVRYSTIYGSLATVPIFLVWLYVVWIIVLVGLEVVYTHQHLDALIRSRAAGGAGRRPVTEALRLYTLIGDRFDKAVPPPTATELAEQLQLPTHGVEESAGLLVEAGLLVSVAGAGDSTAYVPATSLDRVPVSDVIRAIVRDAGEPAASEPPLEEAVSGVIQRFLDAGHVALADATVRDVLREAEAGDREENGSQG